MTIGTCAWMEKNWLKTIPDIWKESFRAKRYMDDVILVTSGKEHPAIAALEKCYLDPLKLEDGGTNTFLETTFQIDHNNIRTWLKNDNKLGGPTNKWRYAHFHSHGAFQQKRAVMMACLKKIHKMASDPEALLMSAVTKLHEFIRLAYPEKMLWTACTTMGVDTRRATWFDIRDMLPILYNLE